MMQLQTVFARAAIALVSAFPLNTFAAPVLVPEPGSTLEQVRELVEKYFESKPGLRPTDQWLALNPPPSCSKPRYPRAGLRDELMGTTVLSFNIAADGKAVNVRLRKSSGWAVLDEAAFEALATCKLEPDTTDTQSVSYRFYLN